MAHLETHTARPRRRPLTGRSRWQTWRRAASAERRLPTRIGTSIGTRRTTTSCRHCSEPCVTWRRARRDRFSSSRPRFAVRTNDSGLVQRQDVRNSTRLAACPAKIPDIADATSRRESEPAPRRRTRRRLEVADAGRGGRLSGGGAHPLHVRRDSGRRGLACRHRAYGMASCATSQSMLRQAPTYP